MPLNWFESSFDEPFIFIFYDLLPLFFCLVPLPLRRLLYLSMCVQFNKSNGHEKMKILFLGVAIKRFVQTGLSLFFVSVGALLLTATPYPRPTSIQYRLSFSPLLVLCLII